MICLFLITGSSVGVGKSELARGYIQDSLRDPDLIVSSPTFTIEQQYEHPALYPIHHIDLYRLSPKDQIPVDLCDGRQLASAFYAD